MCRSLSTCCTHPLSYICDIIPVLFVPTSVYHDVTLRKHQITVRVSYCKQQRWWVGLEGTEASLLLIKPCSCKLYYPTHPPSPSLSPPPTSPSSPPTPPSLPPPLSSPPPPFTPPSSIPSCLLPSSPPPLLHRHIRTLIPVLTMLNGATQLVEVYENTPGVMKMPRMLQLVKQLKKELNIEKIINQRRHRECPSVVSARAPSSLRDSAWVLNNRWQHTEIKAYLCET